MKDVSKMSESELRQELKAWREFGADVFRRLTISRYQERRVLESLQKLSPSSTSDIAGVYAAMSNANLLTDAGD